MTKEIINKKQVPASDRTMCDATAQMLEKARRMGRFNDCNRTFRYNVWNTISHPD